MKIHGIITSFEEAQKIINGIRERRIPGVLGMGPYRQEYYRGQLCAEWNLKPSITRSLKTGDEVKHYEKLLLDTFKNKMIETKQLNKLLIHELPDGYQNEWALLSQAQHYGIPTRLMDWTLKAEVGLYFAVDDSKFDFQDGTFSVIYVPQEKILIDNSPERNYNHYPLDKIEGTLFINPAFYQHNNSEETVAERRRARQHGKFSIQAYNKAITGIDDQEEFCNDYFKDPNTVIEQYLIPAKYKAQLRLDLISQGIFGEFLYFNEDSEINKVRDYCKSLLP